MEAIVLAGGLGTRLRPVVGDVPKPMAPVAGRPFLEILLEQLEGGGIRRVVLSVGYRRDLISAHFGARFGELDLAYSEETEPLGTGGAIRRAIERVQADLLWVINGDTFVELDHRELWRRHASVRRDDPKLLMSMALHRVPDATRYGTVAVEAGRVTAFRPAGSPGPDWINAGVYLLDRSLLAGCPLEDPFSFERDYLEPRVASLRPLAYETTQRFIDIGVPEDYERAESLLR